MIGKGVVDGTVAVGSGTVAVGKETGNMFKRASQTIVKMVKSKYTLENAVERSMNLKFVDRPDIKKSRARKITVKEREEHRSKVRDELKRAEETLRIVKGKKEE